MRHRLELQKGIPFHDLRAGLRWPLMVLNVVASPALTRIGHTE